MATIDQPGPVATEARSVDGLGLGMLIGAVVIAPFGLGPALEVTAHWWVILLTIATAVLSNVIPYGLDQVILQRLARARFAFLMALLPVTATVTGLVALRQTPGGIDLLGIGLVVVGIAVSERSREPVDPSQAA